MRILMISDVYFPRINGVSTSIQTFRRGLHAAGHETILIAPEYPGAPADHETAILRAPSRGVPRDPEDRAMKLGALRALRAEVERLEPDLVHIQTPFIAHYQGTALARALRVPVVETYHTYFEEYLHHYVPLMPCAVMRFVARRFTVSQCNVLDALVVPSRAMEQALLDYGVRCPMHIIPTGMEMERFAGGNGQRFRAQLGVPVVSTAHMGTADIMNPQRGARVAPDDEAEFANIVVQLLEDAPRRAAMSAEARAYAATWSASSMADRLAGLYSAVLGQASRNSPVSQPV
jgi:glycosyltransferase involved in cell wall biosynthesis